MADKKNPLTKEQQEELNDDISSSASINRIVLDRIVNKQTQNLVEQMLSHRNITMKDGYPSDHQFNVEDLLDISFGFILHEIAGLQCLLRGDLAEDSLSREANVMVKVPISNGGDA
tara:strand:+ start:10550 stop:10897 length:348 start_codon:yes stop_codon:yes gene_type:complete